ncbi:MAG: hypothetical protein NVSMB49_26010 [Ktedonobacteraceae bacterium]
MFLSSDRQNDLVQVPFGPALGTPTAQFVGIGLPECASTIVELFHGSPQRLVGPKLFDQTENGSREAGIQPDRVTDTSGGKRNSLSSGAVVFIFIRLF